MEPVPLICFLDPPKMNEEPINIGATKLQSKLRPATTTSLIKGKYIYIYIYIYMDRKE